MHIGGNAPESSKCDSLHAESSLKGCFKLHQELTKRNHACVWMRCVCEICIAKHCAGGETLHQASRQNEERRGGDGKSQNARSQTQRPQSKEGKQDVFCFYKLSTLYLSVLL